MFSEQVKSISIIFTPVLWSLIDFINMHLIMKKFLSVITFVIFYFSISCSQVSQTEYETVKGAGIAFEETSYDYGTMSQGSDGSHDFIFHNDGTEPLLLNNVRSSCGCTIPEWPKEPIAPGETGTIKVSYNTRIIGSFSKSITVYSTADERPVVLEIKGKVEAAGE